MAFKIIREFFLVWSSVKLVSSAKVEAALMSSPRLPTYFHDNFPDAQSWIFNIVPWILMVPGTITGGYLSQRLLAKGYSIGSTRKILETICMGTEIICLVIIGKFLFKT